MQISLNSNLTPTKDSIHKEILKIIKENNTDYKKYKGEGEGEICISDARKQKAISFIKRVPDNVISYFHDADCIYDDIYFCFQKKKDYYIGILISEQEYVYNFCHRINDSESPKRGRGALNDIDSIIHLIKTYD